MTTPTARQKHMATLLRCSETGDRNEPFRILPPGSEEWVQKKATRLAREVDAVFQAAQREQRTQDAEIARKHKHTSRPGSPTLCLAEGKCHREIAQAIEAA